MHGSHRLDKTHKQLGRGMEIPYIMKHSFSTKQKISQRTTKGPDLQSETMDSLTLKEIVSALLEIDAVSLTPHNLSLAFYPFLFPLIWFSCCGSIEAKPIDNKIK